MAGVPADPNLLGAPEAQGLRKEVAGSPVMVRAETTQQRVCAPEERQAGPDPGQGGEADGLPVLPAQSGHALTGVYLKRITNRPDDHCWWCDTSNDRGTHQTRDHLFKVAWKDQQATLWAEVKRETVRRKQRWRVSDLLADDRCSPAFLRNTYWVVQLLQWRKTTRAKVRRRIRRKLCNEGRGRGGERAFEGG